MTVGVARAENVKPKSTANQYTRSRYIARSLITINALGLAPMLSAQAKVPDVASGSYLLQVVLGLAAIVVLILALAWVLKRVNRFTGFQNQQLMSITGQMPLGIKEKLIVVEVAGQHLLLGVTPTNISLLHTFAEGEDPVARMVAENKNSSGETASVLTFQQILRKVSNRE